MKDAEAVLDMKGGIFALLPRHYCVACARGRHVPRPLGHHAEFDRSQTWCEQPGQHEKAGGNGDERAQDKDVAHASLLLLLRDNVRHVGCRMAETGEVDREKQLRDRQNDTLL